MTTLYSYKNDPQVPSFQDDKPIIIFDGICVLCSSWIDFVITHDHSQKFRFIVAQSDLGRSIYRHYDLDDRDFPTNILLLSGQAYFKWDGTIRMFVLLGWPWRIVAISRFLPLKLQERLYDWIASHRFSWFGKREQCRMPTDDLRARFLD